MKRNISKLQERMKEIQKQMREAERAFYASLGKSLESKLTDSECTLNDIRDMYEKIKKDFGR
ncbi:hypothetical protein TISLANDTSLP1_16670 [Thermodesulfovibrio yellowstonii]|uniref:Uncharacterized protein n=2 Tax=Thermodesulfovibrio yellowstonii TaxID=28262 RepID=A0A9W6LKU0_9BACT|nr:hypothetical protein TISLANDTSLP1_16670 [Thermodesulfovibrio islandicus]